MRHLLAAQTSEVMLKEEAEFPSEFRFIEGQSAGDGITLKGFGGGCLNLRDQRDGLLFVLITLFFGGRFINQT